LEKGSEIKNGLREKKRRGRQSAGNSGVTHQPGKRTNKTKETLAGRWMEATRDKYCARDPETADLYGQKASKNLTMSHRRKKKYRRSLKTGA